MCKNVYIPMVLIPFFHPIFANSVYQLSQRSFGLSDTVESVRIVFTISNVRDFISILLKVKLWDGFKKDFSLFERQTFVLEQCGNSVWYVGLILQAALKLSVLQLWSKDSVLFRNIPGKFLGSLRISFTEIHILLRPCVGILQKRTFFCFTFHKSG